jgi:glutamate racemase
MTSEQPIGVFDSGYGGLSILKAFTARLPTQNFLYLGDHRNAPYGHQSQAELYRLTTTNIDWLFKQNCKLVILACNTASSILRTIQHEWLPRFYPDHRVLGVVVPTIERVTGMAWDFPAAAQAIAPSASIGIFATEATVTSQVYPLEIHKRAPHIHVVQQACPSLVPMIEANAPQADIAKVVQHYVAELRAQLNGALPDYVILGCTHYALIEDFFRAALTPFVQLIDQPDYVASRLEDYLKRHAYFRSETSHPAALLFTTGDEKTVNKNGRAFLSGSAQFKTVKM